MQSAPDRPAAEVSGAAPGGSAPSAWSPFGHPVFRVLWIATLVANIGTWIHDVAATWLMTSLAPSALLVALVQTATTLPVLMFALPAGVLADVLDRRRVLLFAQVWMTVVAVALGLVTLAGASTPLVLLLFTFLLGIGTALTAPAWQSIVPELVPGPELAPAVTLNSAGINVARAVGPALGGLVVAATGPAAAFLLNGFSFAGVIGALIWWRRAVPVSGLPAERLTAAFGTGLRFVRSEPRLIAVLARTLAFIAFGSALWALLPLVARQQLGAGALGYGLLLGAIGVGALLATALLPRARGLMSPDRLVLVATIVYAAVTVATATVRVYPVVLALLVFGGAAWLVLLATFQSGAQLAVPSWVRGRAIAAYLMVFFGGQAAGSVVWGSVAEQVGIPLTLLHRRRRAGAWSRCRGPLPARRNRAPRPGAVPPLAGGARATAGGRRPGPAAGPRGDGVPDHARGRAPVRRGGGGAAPRAAAEWRRPVGAVPRRKRAGVLRRALRGAVVERAHATTRARHRRRPTGAGGGARAARRRRATRRHALHRRWTAGDVAAAARWYPGVHFHPRRGARHGTAGIHERSRATSAPAAPTATRASRQPSRRDAGEGRPAGAHAARARSAADHHPEGTEHSGRSVAPRPPRAGELPRSGERLVSLRR
jgi:MFS family permease